MGKPLMAAQLFTLLSYSRIEIVQMLWRRTISLELISAFQMSGGQWRLRDILQQYPGKRFPKNDFDDQQPSYA